MTDSTEGDTALRAAIEHLQQVLTQRYGAAMDIPPGLARTDVDVLAFAANRRTHRSWHARPLDHELLRLLCACALAAPSKSDLQQRDIVIVSDPRIRAQIAALLPHMPWVARAPAFIVFCANASRVREVSRLRGKPFPNNHLDLFFNAVGDAAIALATCVAVAERIGLGCCPISEIRNHAATIDALLGLPPQVIAFAGLCIGWPDTSSTLSPRMPLALTVHENRFADVALDDALRAYDRRREALQPYADQYQTERWGRVPEYGWSEQKARQYAVPQRTDFGAFVRTKGFVLD